jgi:hypothetical protein
MSIIPKLFKKQNRLQGSSLFCSKGVLGLEINEIIRGITSNALYNTELKKAIESRKKNYLFFFSL